MISPLFGNEPETEPGSEAGSASVSDHAVATEVGDSSGLEENGPVSCILNPLVTKPNLMIQGKPAGPVDDNPKSEAKIESNIRADAVADPAPAVGTVNFGDPDQNGSVSCNLSPSVTDTNLVTQSKPTSHVNHNDNCKIDSEPDTVEYATSANDSLTGVVSTPFCHSIHPFDHFSH